MVKYGPRMSQMVPKGKNWTLRLIRYSQLAPNGLKWLQNDSKWFQIAMAKANGYSNGPTLSQMVPNGPKWSKTIHNDPT